MGLAVQRSKRALKSFLAGSPLSTRLILLTLHLADCDAFYRSGKIRESFCTQTRSDVAELRKLINATNIEVFRARDVCLLNPEFGEGTRLIGGADADLLIDDLLIDVKTSTKLSLEPRDWYQLIGYAALNHHFPIGGGNNPVPIRRLGIFFARYNHLVTWPLNQVVDPQKFDAFATWLRDYLLAEEAIRIASTLESEREDAALKRPKRKSKQRRPTVKHKAKKKQASKKRAKKKKRT